MIAKRWVLKSPGHSETVEQLSKQLNINPVLANLLVQRGITTFEEARDFFRPSLSMLHDPFLMADMQKAVERIEKAIINKEKVLIYGDYDVDGTTSVAMMFTFMKDYFHSVDYYIPDRNTEGYGISFQGIDYAAQSGFTLVIALDCGIKAIDKMEYANKKGIDFIICDHHRPGAELPKAFAVLDPKRVDCKYPYKELAGCGVGFKLIQAFAKRNDIAEEKVNTLLDLVAISIAADIVPITGENRVLAYFGLKELNRHPRPGIRAILELNGIKRDLIINDVVFIIAPRINAAGRMDHGKFAVQLLISDSMSTANLESITINKHNIDRKESDKLITEQALEQINRDQSFSKRRSTVVYDAEWNKGVIGIVASRLSEKFYRPTVVLTSSNGYIAGSARSVKDFDVYNAIESCSDLLDQFGGHMYAAGLTLKHENLEAFKQKFDDVVRASIEEHMLTPEVEIDAVIDLKDITPAFFNVLKQFAPFGPENLSPVFMANHVAGNNQCKEVGNDPKVKHLKLSVTQKGMAKPIGGIAFQMGEHAQKVKSGLPFDICFHIEENHFNGNIDLQLMVKDLRFQENK
jgi:single-stranded-DNA-specific exonuclease